MYMYMYCRSHNYMYMLVPKNPGWKFHINPSTNNIVVLPDFSRRCPRVDPDDHHLYATLGCAVENIAIAAPAHGLEVESVDTSNPGEGIQISFSPCEPPHVSDLFKAIPNRQCTRSEYDGTPLSVEELEKLQLAGTGDGVETLTLTDESSIEKALEYIVKANTAQIDNPEWVQELKKWIRFGNAEAVSLGDGLFGKCMGSPTIPRFIGSHIFDLALRSGSENAKIRRQVKSSSGLAVIVSDKDDVQHWIEAGRAYERFALQATALGIRNAFLNQPVEEASIRPAFATSLGLDVNSRPDLIVRFGRGKEMPRSLRRPVDTVTLYAN